MTSLLVALVFGIQAREQTPAIYRCPAVEAESEMFDRVVDESYFDGVCIEPKPGPRAQQRAAGKLRFVDAKTIDTSANLKWRNATIAFCKGEISPKKWIENTKGLKETVHFLTSPKTKDLRTEMSSVPVPPHGTFSARSVFAEMLLLSLPGRLCLTSSDIWTTKPLPPSGRLQSWVLAMNDWLGPQLYSRASTPYLVKAQIKVIRADAKPGLLIYSQTDGKRSITCYFNNGFKEAELPPIDMEKVTFNRGLNFDGPKPTLMPAGNFYVIAESPR